MVALFVEIPHSDLSKVTRMVLVHVCSVVVLSTSKTSTTGMLAVLAYTTVAGGDVAATITQVSSAFESFVHHLSPIAQFEVIATPINKSKVTPNPHLNR